MRSILEFLAALGVPLLEVDWWERSSIISRSQIDAAGLDEDFVLAQHETPASFVAVLLWWQQYYWGATQPTDQILHLAAETGYWKLLVGGEPPDKQLEKLPDIRHPWRPDVGNGLPCFYTSMLSASRPVTELIIHPILHVEADYYFGGMITGMDIPKQYFEQEVEERMATNRMGRREG